MIYNKKLLKIIKTKLIYNKLMNYKNRQNKVIKIMII